MIHADLSVLDGRSRITRFELIMVIKALTPSFCEKITPMITAVLVMIR